jgi:hypothetical protein
MNKDDNDIPFFKTNFGGRPRKTSIEDLLLKEVANNNLWGRLSHKKMIRDLKIWNQKFQTKHFIRV